MSVNDATPWPSQRSIENNMLADNMPCHVQYVSMLKKGARLGARPAHANQHALASRAKNSNKSNSAIAAH